MEVFRVDLARNALEPVRSIGKNRALVLGFQPICIDAGNVPGFEGNCIYYGNGFLGKTGICVYRVEDGWKATVFGRASGASGPAAMSVASALYRQFQRQSKLKDLKFDVSHAPRLIGDNAVALKDD